MNRYLSLIVLIILYSFCSLFIYDHPQAIFDQQINLVDHQDSDSAIDDNGKFKYINFIPELFLFLIVISITSSDSLFAAFTRRLMQLTTIFYQSNYLINSLK